MSEAEKQGQVNEMWAERIHGGWWNLESYYHRAYRGVSWPPGARAEVSAARAVAVSDPRG